MKTIFYLFLALLFTSKLWSQPVLDSSILKIRAPERFEAVFTTTKGDFRVEVIREWSPAGADRLYQLVMTGFYDNSGLFRVQPDYVVQFGISDNPETNRFWDRHPIPDEPVKQENLKGTIAYARDGALTRTAQLFINLKDNHKLDTMMFNGLLGFTPVGKIIEGFEVVETLYSGYGFEPANHQDSVMVKGNAYWKEHFPEIDYIVRARVQ